LSITREPRRLGPQRPASRTFVACRINPTFRAAKYDAFALQSGEEEHRMARAEQLQAAFEHLREAAKLLASAGLPLLAEEVEELALQVDLQAAE